MSSKLSSMILSRASLAFVLVTLLATSVFSQTDTRNTATSEPSSSIAKPKTDTNPAITPKYTTPTNPLDAAYGAKIKEYTTEKYFMTELVDHLPASDTVPSPDKVLGYAVGTPNKLTHVADLYRYYRELAAASRRACVFSSRRKRVKKAGSRCW